MTTIILYYNNKIKGLLYLLKLAKKQKFSFSKKQSVGNNIIAFDKRKQKLVYCMQTPVSSCIIIDLQQVHNCKAVKQYKAIEAGGLPKKNLHDYVSNIFLRLIFKNGTNPITLPFFEFGKDTADVVSRRESKVKDWEHIITNELLSEQSSRA